MIPRLSLLLAIAAAGLMIACGGDDDAPGETGAPSNSAPPASGLPSALILYRDASGNLTLEDFAAGQRFQYSIDFTKGIVVGAQCSRDGTRFGRLEQDFSTVTRSLTVSGAGAPGEPLEVPSFVQSFGLSPDGARVVYNEFDGNAVTHVLTLVDVDTGDATTLISADGYAGTPVWSPDGTHIAYSLQDQAGLHSDIYTLDLSGGAQPRKVTDGAITYIDPDWSPDGATLVYAGLEEQSLQLYELDLASGEQTQLTQSADIYKRGPMYSPDGTQIAYTGSIIVPGVSAVAAALHSFGIFILDAEGGTEQPLTADPRLNPGANVDPYLDAFLLGWCKRGDWLDDGWEPAE